MNHADWRSRSRCFTRRHLDGRRCPRRPRRPAPPGTPSTPGTPRCPRCLRSSVDRRRSGCAGCRPSLVFRSGLLPSAPSPLGSRATITLKDASHRGMSMSTIRGRSPADRPPKYCRQCGYELHGLDQPRCSECGRPFDPHDPRAYLTEPLPISRSRNRAHRMVRCLLAVVLSCL